MSLSTYSYQSSYYLKTLVISFPLLFSIVFKRNKDQQPSLSIVGTAITKQGAMYKTDTLNEGKKLRVTKLEEW